MLLLHIPGILLYIAYGCTLQQYARFIDTFSCRQEITIHFHLHAVYFRGVGGAGGDLMLTPSKYWYCIPVGIGKSNRVHFTSLSFWP